MSELGQTALAVAGGSASVGVGLVFLTAGIAKLRSHRIFPGVVANYRLLPQALVAPVAACLPYVEFIVGAGLLAGLSLMTLPAVALLLVFAAAMAVNIARGRAHIDCGCGRSELRQPLSWTLVVRNVALSLLLLPALFNTPGILSAEWLIALAGGAALYLLTLLVNALAALATGPLAAMERNS